MVHELSGGYVPRMKTTDAEDVCGDVMNKVPTRYLKS